MTTLRWSSGLPSARFPNLLLLLPSFFLSVLDLAVPWLSSTAAFSDSAMSWAVEEPGPTEFRVAALNLLKAR